MARAHRGAYSDAWEMKAFAALGKSLQPEHVRALKKVVKRERTGDLGSAVIHCQLCQTVIVRKRARALRPEHAAPPDTIACAGCYLRENAEAVARLAERFALPADVTLHLQQRYVSALASAPDRDMAASMTLDHVFEKWLAQRGICALSGRHMTAQPVTRAPRQDLLTASIDRIDNAQGYIDGNVHWTCWGANRLRQSLSIPELSAWCADIVRHLKP